MTHQTHHLKLPILTFVYFACGEPARTEQCRSVEPWHEKRNEAKLTHSDHEKRNEPKLTGPASHPDPRTK
jgi:hypothetical protein